MLLGLGVAVAVLGPALAPGALVSLDLVVTPTIPVPDAVYGLGPELPRRVPWGAPLAWLAHVTSGPLAVKAFLLGAVTAAFVGAVRLARPTPWPARLTGGLLYAAGPFFLTRLGAGHLGVLLAMAVLPFALPHLTRAADDRARALLWLAALGATGFVGGITGALLAVAGLRRADGWRRAGQVLALVVVTQLPWLVPGILVIGGGLSLGDAGAFATHPEGPLGVVGAVLAQHGFWRPASQIGGQAGTGLALVGAGLTALALYGHRDLPEGWRRGAIVGAGVGFGVAVAAGLPGLRDAYAWLTSAGPFAALREGHRLLALFVLWLAPAAAHGAARAAREMRELRPAPLAFPLIAAVVLGAPGLIGAGGRLEPVDYPSGWAQARRAVDERPGTVLALPWHQYLDLGFADDRRALNPLPDYLGGDVIVAADPEFGVPLQESTDPRLPSADALVARLLDGESIATALARLQVRWVVLVHEVDWREYSALATDPGLDRVVATPSLDLWEVTAWPGSLVAPASPSTVVSRDPLLTPVAGLDSSEPTSEVLWSRPGGDGWMLGWSRVTTTESGLARLPGGSGLLWYWPALVVFVADAVTAAAVVAAAVKLRRSRAGER